ATPWLPVKQDKIQQYEISMPVNLSIEAVSQPDNNPQDSVRPDRAPAPALARWLILKSKTIPPVDFLPQCTSSVSPHCCGKIKSTLTK
ncbi:hypothetical protein M9458_056836, partial [Cirrhinus mrigala]